MDDSAPPTFTDGDISSQCRDTWIPNIAMSTFMIIIVIIGLFGNAIVFFVILVLKEYRKSVSNWYVLQLALADTLFLLMLPFGAAEQMAGRWAYPTSLCKAKEGILMVNYYASIIFLTIMSFDRFMAVTKSVSSKWTEVLRRLDSAALISLIAWLVSISLAVPIYLYSTVTDCDACTYVFPTTNQEKCDLASVNASNCEEWLRYEDPGSEQEIFEKDELNQLFRNISGDFGDDFAGDFGGGIPNLKLETDMCTYASAPNSYRTWLYLNASISLFLPFVLICIFYGLILKAMMGTATTSCTNQRQYRRRVTMMVLALVTLFLVSWLPWYAVTLARVRGFPMSAHGCSTLQDFVRILSYLNSALNPYFYSLLSTRFPRRLQSALTKTQRFTAQMVMHRYGSRKRSSTFHGVSFPQTLPKSSIDCHT